MDVNDGRPGLGGVDRGGRDLLRSDRYGRVLARRIRRSGQRARDHDLALHHRLPRLLCPFGQPTAARRIGILDRGGPAMRAPCLALCAALSLERVPGTNPNWFWGDFMRSEED